MDEEDEDVAVEESDFMPNEKGLGKPPPPSRHLLGPICPICAKALGPSTSNQDLNDHVDWCLNRDAISEASKKTPKRVKREYVDGPVDDRARKKGTKDMKPGTGMMSSWLTKE